MRTRLSGAVELRVVERRQHDVVHGAAGRDARDQRAHQQPRQRRVAVGEMIDVGLARLRRSPASGSPSPRSPDSRARARRRPAPRRSRAPKKSERAALEAVGDLVAAAADLDQESRDSSCVLSSSSFSSTVLPASGSRVPVVERDELRLARVGDRKSRDELGERLARCASRGSMSSRDHGQRIAGHQRVAAECLAREEHAARQAERGIEIALERGLEARDVDAELAQQALGDVAPERLAATASTRCRHSR